MLLTLLVVAGLWFVAALLRWLLRSRLPPRLRSRWIMITGAVSAFLLAEAQAGTALSWGARLLFAIVVAAAAGGTAALYPRLRAHVANWVIFLVLMMIAMSFVYLRGSMNVVWYYSLGVVAGILLYFAFHDRDRGHFTPWAGSAVAEERKELSA